ncbi:type IV pilin [Natronosalvus amylolyticus]|uniref:type IV pilin n=1 Tax=Natronosalvus amylolyticus TaxID=2961994 RepID=UPI0020C9832D|nr:type IV pilin N-terminal domain-containing protein [Natronosalvus amylolyticus]
MQMESKIQTEDESSSRAVSPVIGVILMVAITVILAAVIAAFVLDLGQSSSANVNAAVTIDNDSSEVTFTLTDKGNAEYVEIRNPSDGSLAEDDDSRLDTVGASWSTPDNNQRYTVVAVSGDDETQIGTHNP